MKIASIALDGKIPHAVFFSSKFTPGAGEVIINGQFLPDVEETINQCLQVAWDIGLYLGIEEEKLLSHNLLLTIRSVAPLTGPSFGLALALVVLGPLLNFEIPENTIYTGELSPDGMILPVGDIELKRQGAEALGYDYMYLPASQLEYFGCFISQYPVSSLLEAVTLHVHTD